MLRAYVKHYLTPAGKSYFNTWFVEVKEAMHKYPGYIRFEYEEDHNDLTCINLMVEFESEETATVWGNSKIHDLLVAQLDPYRIKAWQFAKIILPSKNAPEPELNWITVT